LTTTTPQFGETDIISSYSEYHLRSVKVVEFYEYFEGKKNRFFGVLAGIGRRLSDFIGI
jgi:hypothetical protein